MSAQASVGLSPVRVTLYNGVVVLAKQTQVTPAVTILASMRAGSLHDPPALAGLAHFASRTLDRGTDHRTAAQIADELENRGVSLTLTVGRHMLALACTCLREDLESVLAVMADVIRHAAFPAAEVETRRGEVLTVIRQDQDNPAVVATEHLLPLLYGEGHPYARRLRGTPETVSAIGVDDLRAFHARHFVPDALSLVMVGDVAPGDAVDAAGRVFGAWDRKAPEPLLLPLPSSASARLVRVVPMMNKVQADVAYGFLTIERGDPRYYAYWLMNNILGQYSMGGRLGDSIRERQGMAYYAYSAFDADLIPGPLIVRAGVNPANVERAVSSIDSELTRMAADGPTDQELAESKQYLIGSLPRSLETNAAIAGFLQSAEFFGLGLDYDQRLPQLLTGVTREDVHAAARGVLDPSRASVVVAGPYSGALE